MEKMHKNGLLCEQMYCHGSSVDTKMCVFC